MTVRIHPSAVVEPKAQIGDGTVIGPFCYIGGDVVIGRENLIGPNTVIDGHTTIGDENHFFQFSSIGAVPQDLKYHGEPSTLSIGDKNIIREYVTLQPGTSGGGMKTVIGHSNLFMACSHVGHDGLIGDHNVIANSAALAGHVVVGSYVTIGGLCGIHQFVHLGDMCILGAGSMVAKDIPPFCIAQGDRAGLVGLNQVGLERRQISETEILRLRKLYRMIFSTTGTMEDRLSQARPESSGFELGLKFIEFIAGSSRGVALPRKQTENTEA